MTKKQCERTIVVAILLLALFPITKSGTYLSSKALTLRNYKSPTSGEETLIQSQLTFETLAAWEKVVESTHFSVYYNVTGPNAVTDQYAINVSDSLEHSWTREVTDFGFQPPPDSHIIVYIENIWAYGITYYYGPPYHVSNITIDTCLTVDLIRTTSAHELFHTIQLSYDITEADWIIEGTATWMMSKVYPYFTGPGSYIDWVNVYMSNPDRTITNLSYDAVLFWVFIDEQRGGINTIENVLQQTTGNDDIYAVNATLVTRGTTFAKTFKEWTIANYLKDTYYAKGTLFNPIAKTTFSYNGNWVQFSTDVADWGIKYYETTSSVIYMEVQFTGTQYHNLTRIFIDDSNAIISDILLDGTYSGSFRLMQANIIEKVVVIVRSIATETSSGRRSYILTWLGFTPMQSGPYDLTSSLTSLSIRDTGTQSSSTTSLEAFGQSSSQFSSTTTANTISNAPSQSSASQTVSTISTSNAQTSSTTTLDSIDNVCSQSSSQSAIVAISNLSSQTSFETPTQVSPAPPVVSFDYSPPLPYVNGTVIFNASLSYDPDGYIMSYTWNFGDGNTTNTVNPIITHVYTTAGSYAVVLNVTDNQGLWSTLSEPITIFETAILSVDIKDVVITDQNGNPKTNFIRGEIVRFNFCLENTGSLILSRGLVSVEVLDPLNIPVFLSYTFEDLDIGASKEFIIGYGIPLGGVIGTYTVKTMVFTNWPSQGGIGLDIETSTFDVS